MADTRHSAQSLLSARSQGREPGEVKYEANLRLTWLADNEKQQLVDCCNNLMEQFHYHYLKVHK